MTSVTYFDCNPFMRWAEQRAAGASDRSTHIAEAVDALLEDAARERYISEVTIAEYHSNAMNYSRGGDTRYGDVWLGDVIGRFFQLIADGKLAVLAPPPRLIERAMALAATASREHGIALRAWDAVHLTYAYDLARFRVSQVYLCSSDHVFNRLLEAYPAIGEQVILLDPDVGRSA